MEIGAPRDLPSLLKLIDSKEAVLSHQFHMVARYMVANPDEVALAPVRILAKHIGAHPSTIVRFAKALNYTGFKEMQLVFKSAVYSRAHGINSKVSRLDNELAARGKRKVDNDARAVVAGEITSLELLLGELATRDLDRAAKLILAARIVWIITDLDGFPASWQLVRALNGLSRDARLLEAATPKAQEQIRVGKGGDTVIAVTLGAGHSLHGSPEVDLAVENGCRLITISSDLRMRQNVQIAFVLPSADTQPPPALASPAVFMHILGRHVANLIRPQDDRMSQFAGFDPLGW